MEPRIENARFGEVKLRRPRWLLATLLVLYAALGTVANAEDRRYYTGFAGIMTSNRWHEVFDFGELDLVDSGFVGVGIGWDRQIGDSRFSYGIEIQGIRHFGHQDHFEFNLPLILRYTPSRPFPRRLNSLAFGLGPSHATKIPQVEIDRKGASQRNFVYWLAEAEFTTNLPKANLYFRLHHRSDGYGLFKVSSGATALVLGLRHSF